MKLFVNDLRQDLWRIGWKSAGAIAFIVIAAYGMLLVNPTTAYDFSAAKGDGLQVFLTHFFMRRFANGAIAGLFHDFTPMWNWSVGLLALFVFGNLLLVLSRRMKLSPWQSLIFVMLWISSPFFFNISLYQHAMPAEPIAFCFDALTLLLFAEIRGMASFEQRFKYIIVSAICGFVSVSVYQAHAPLLLTAMLGVCCICPRSTWRDLFYDTVEIVSILGLSVFLWAFVSWGPILVAKMFGVLIPPSGGAHDAVYWFCGKLSFEERVCGLLAGLAINWVYNAFFVVGLRWVLVFLVVGCGMVVLRLWQGKRIYAVYIGMFIGSIFVMPCLQCSATNLRVLLCLNPFVGFSGALLMNSAMRRKRKMIGILCNILMVFAVGSLAHETAMLYYYQWKVKTHDALHMGNVAKDIWRMYGISPDKPVAVIGGWSHYPTCWEDMRPNRDMPLLVNPFSTYSNMTDNNVPREFYMVAREKVGLVVDMPTQDAYAKAKKLTGMSPGYPRDGYIFEKDGLIIVNLGSRSARWKRFDFGLYRSPNENLLFRTLGGDRWHEFKLDVARCFLSLAKRYPWALTVE